MDIIVTTPKGEMANAAREAEDVRRAGGGMYFRRFPLSQRPSVSVGERVYYVEDGYVRGFAWVHAVEEQKGVSCGTTGRQWPPGFYVYMDATTWQWIEPIPMRGFQGFRYVAESGETPGYLLPVKIVGGWLDPRPDV